MKAIAPMILGLLLASAIPTLTLAQGGFGGSSDTFTLPPSPDPAETPITPAAARIWTSLAQPISMAFSNETPLEDLLKYVQSATQDSEQGVGVQIYVDPLGLQEAEKTLQSPITLALEGIPISVSLKLALDQLDLAYRVQPEGFILITYKGRFDEARNAQAEAIARELNSLRQEVATLREELSRLRAASPEGSRGSVVTTSNAGTPSPGFQ